MILQSLLDRLSKIFSASTEERAEELPQVDPSLVKEFDEILQAIREEASEKRGNLGQSEQYMALKKKPVTYRKAFLYFLLAQYQDKSPSYLSTESKLIGLFLRTDLAYQDSDFAYLIDVFKSFEGYTHVLPYKSLMNRLEAYVSQHGLSESLRKSVQKLRFEKGWVYAEELKLNRRLDLLLGDDAAKVLNTQDAFGKPFKVLLQDLSSRERNAWQMLLEHIAAEASQRIPSPEWQEQAHKIVAAIPQTSLMHILGHSLESLIEILNLHHRGTASEPYVDFMSKENVNLAQGLLWIIGIEQLGSLYPLVEEVGWKSFKKIPGYGPLSLKLGNAALYVLSVIPVEYAMARLTKLRGKIRRPGVVDRIESIIQDAAEKAGKMQDEMEEMLVPDFGLDVRQFYREKVGDCVARLEVAKINQVSLTWDRVNGKQLRTLPKGFKEKYELKIKELNLKKKEIQSTLQSQKKRIEGLFLKSRSWSFADWLPNYHEHTLVSFLSHKFIWLFEDGSNIRSAMYDGGNFIDCEGDVLDWLKDDTKVSLWHPIMADALEISRWRAYLMDRQIRQPFKQAFREVYRPLDHEKELGNYSDRFASHIVKQHNFKASCEIRGWRYAMCGDFDTQLTANLEIPHWNMQAKFELSTGSKVDNVQESVFLRYVFTDQITFHKTGKQLEIRDVPPVVFSEVMRDVDLFISSTSIGNDPTWIKKGEGQYQEYWDKYSFGDLNQTALTRKEVLKSIIPKQKIHNRAHFEANFLSIRGELAQYKIHFGSGHILVEPSKQYLHMIPDPSRKPSNIFIPFDEDPTLSIILSKAFVLAQDTKIKDRSILAKLKDSQVTE